HYALRTNTKNPLPPPQRILSFPSPNTLYSTTSSSVVSQARSGLPVLVPLPLEHRDPRAAGFTHQNRLVQHLGGGVRKVWARPNDFPCGKFELAGGAADVDDASVRFNKIARVDR